MVLLTAVYSLSWYHNLNYLILQLHEDILVWLRGDLLIDIFAKSVTLEYSTLSCSSTTSGYWS